VEITKYGINSNDQLLTLSQNSRSQTYKHTVGIIVELGGGGFLGGGGGGGGEINVVPFHVVSVIGLINLALEAVIFDWS